MDRYTTSSLSIHLLIDIQVSSMCWLLWIALRWHRGACIFSNYSFLWKYAQKWDCRMLSSAAQSPLTPWTAERQAPCPSPAPGVYSNSCPLSQWCHQTISSSVVPTSSCLNLSQIQGLFQWVSSSHQVAKVLEFQLQHQSFQWTPRTDLL